MTGRVLLAALAVTLAVAGHAQQPAAPEQRAWNAFDEGKYLAAVDGLRCACPEGSPCRGTLDQYRAMLNGFTDPPPPFPVQPLSTESAAKLRAAKPADAIRLITERAKRTSIVILNENHSRPEHRAFGLQVARALRPLGYTILAAEAFSNATGDQAKAPITQLARNRYPNRSTGIYTQDPVFGDFVRQSLALGYRPAAYEQTGEQRKAGSGIAEREQAQADNLAAIIAANPGVKLLVFVGFSHVTEAPIPDRAEPTSWMATRLKKQTGIDPLTIDQTGVDSHASRSGREAHDLVAPRLRRPAILQAGGEPVVLGLYAGAVDLQVVHPKLQLVSGRPAWLAGMGRSLRPIPRELLPARGRRLVQAFLRHEGEDAIPIEQVVVEAGKPVPKLMLPNKSIRFAVQDSSSEC